MTARLVVDLTRCRGHGICTLIFPDHVELDDWGFPILATGDLDSAASLRRAAWAVAGCPRGALSVQQVPRPPAAPGSGAARAR